MAKCYSCGAEIEVGMKFCGECGTPVPQDKECPRCHAHLKIAAKFCSECGYNFSSQNGQQSGAAVAVGDKNVIAGDVTGAKQEINVSGDASAARVLSGCADSGSGVKLGDKNMISGDIVGHQEDYQIRGNATIVKNTDETRQMVKCHVCGRNMIIAESFDCPVCHQKTCVDCYDRSQGSCRDCISNKKTGDETVYRQALTRVFADGKVDLSERRDLMALQKQLGISAARAIELETLVKSEVAQSGNADETLSTFERFSYEKATKALYVDSDPKAAIDLLEPIYATHKLNEQILSTYLDALATFDPSRAKMLIAGLHADILAAYLAEIDILIKEENLTAAEDKLLMAENMWPEDNQLICRRIRFLLMMKTVTGNDEFLAEASGKLSEFGAAKNMLEASWIFCAQRLVSAAMDEPSSVVTSQYCADNGLYYAIVKLSNQN